MALSINDLSYLITKAEHLFANKLNQEFIDSQYNSNVDSKGFNFTLSTDLYHLISALQISLNNQSIDDVTTCLYLELQRRLGVYTDNISQDSNYVPPEGIIIIPGDNQYKTFLSLLDTPDSYAASANFVVTVDSSQDGLQFTNLSSLINVDNGISLSGNEIELGGNPLIKNTTLDLSTFTLSSTQGLLFTSDFSSYFDSNDRAIIDAGYFRNNQWYQPFNSTHNYKSGNLVKYGGLLYYTNTTITGGGTIFPSQALHPTQFSSSNTDGDNITSYLNWVTANGLYTTEADNSLWLEISFATTTNTTFPLFSVSSGVFGEDWIGFSVGTDNNTFNIGYYAEYKFSTGQITTSGVWYELLPTYKSHDFISHFTNVSTHELHIDVAKNPSGGYEFRGRHKLLTAGTGIAYQDYSIEFSRSKARQFFQASKATPSLYWNILNSSVDPNTQLANWKGTDSVAPAILQGATTGAGTRVSYAFLTSGVDNYTSDFSGSYTSLTKISKGYADATYAPSTTLGSYLPLSGGTMTGPILLAADPTTNPQVANKHYVDTAIIAATPTPITFGTGSLVGAGTGVSPFYPNAGNGLTNSDTTDGIILGGTLDRNTTINSSAFDLIFNQSTGGSFITRYKFNTVDQAYVTTDGYFRGSGAYALSGLASGFLSFTSTGAVIGRNMADTIPALKVQQSSTGSTGDILQIQNPYSTVLNITSDSGIVYTHNKSSVSGNAIAHNIAGFLKPTANSDVLTALKIAPTFGSSTIATVGSLSGGSGYPNGTSLVTATGGTGTGAVFQISVTSGVITSISSIINGGVNYTVSDTLTLVSQTSGSGATVSVTSITSYTGVTNVSAQFSNAPIQLNTISTPSTFANGMVWNDGTHLYTRIGGTSYQLDQQTAGGSVNSFNSRTGIVTLTSGDVTTALTFTPYNSTNPSGYIALTALSGTAPITYNSGTGAIGFDFTYVGTYTGKTTFSVNNTASTGNNFGTVVNHTVNQTSVAAFTDLLVNRTQTTVGSGSQLLFDVQLSGTSKFNIQTSGFLTSQSGANFSGSITGGIYSQAASSFDGLYLQNYAPATSGQPSVWSPRIHLVSAVWNTSGTPATNVADWVEEVRPVSSATPSSKLYWAGRTSVSGTGSFVDSMNLDTSGNLTVTKSLRGTAVTFANVPGTPVEGMLIPVTDSTVNTWGSTITGGGANHVLAYYNGTAWTVAAK